MNAKKIIKNKQGLGFAHPVVLVVLLLGVLSVVGFSAHRVYKERSKTEPVSVTQPQETIVIASQPEQESTTAATQQKPVTIQSAGSAAEASASQQNGTSSPTTSSPTKEVLSKYDVATPIGSLSQLAYDAKQGNYDNALYFITPRLMLSAYSAVSSQNISDFENACQNNSACNTLLTMSLEINPTHITESTCTSQSSSFTECRTLSSKFVIENGKISTVYYKTVGYHVHQISLTMLKSASSQHWVIDQITVDNFTL